MGDAKTDFRCNLQGRGFISTTFFMLGKFIFSSKKNNKTLNISLSLSFSCSAGVFLERALNMRSVDGNIRCTYTPSSNLAPLARCIDLSASRAGRATI